MKKKITKKETHDRISVSGTYATGGSFRFTVSRTGESFSWGGSEGREGTLQGQKFIAFCKFKPGENNAQRIQRIYETAQKANSNAEFVALMS